MRFIKRLKERRNEKKALETLKARMTVSLFPKPRSKEGVVKQKSFISKMLIDLLEHGEITQIVKPSPKFLYDNSVIRIEKEIEVNELWEDIEDECS